MREDMRGNKNSDWLIVNGLWYNGQGLSTTYTTLVDGLSIINYKRSIIHS
jgi:hypothetical protein